MAIKDTESKITQFWKENKIFEKSVEQRPKGKEYIFYDGPPFATGLPHYGHILGLTSKDLFPRFWTMKGYRVERKWGWDCHGLPIENIAEKELGSKGKKDIEAMGIGKFNEFCRSKVLFFATEWKKTVDRMGKWIEFDNSYKTMDNSYMESIWYIFKKLHDDKFIYKGKKVLLYCPRCETPLAKAEIAMDKSYKTVTEKTATVKFKVKGEENTYLLAWTTTPWTLVGNVAIAVNEQLTYVKAKIGADILILAKDRVQELKEEYEIIEEFKGEKILNMEYEPLYNVATEKKGYYVINGGDEVTAEDGTGLVHMALYGEFDYEMVKKYDLPVIQHVGLKGELTHGPDEWKGTWFKKADKLVLEELEQRNLLFKADQYTHPYPFCYRCDTPLFYNAVDSWFVDVQKAKSRLLERRSQINWKPEHLKDGWFKDILTTAPDWSISRNRYWATTIPVWECDKQECTNRVVIGSVKELQEKAVDSTQVPNDLDLHKHIVDKIKIKCDCGSEMTRIPEVIDCWFEASSMPYASKHYPFENKEDFAAHFPADFISEYIGQVRAWFYYMHVIGVLLFDKAPFKNVVVTGNILAADGQKMSKSKKNYPDPAKLFDEYGADALRFYLMGSPLMKAEDLNFKEEGVKEVYRKIVMILSNVSRFYGMFAQENKDLNFTASTHVLDQWIVSRVNQTTRDVTNALDDYDTLKACNELMKLVDEISTWFVRRSRDRFKSSNADEKSQAVKTLAYALNTTAKLLAPITPFISETVYQKFKEADPDLKESVHLEDWPVFDAELINENLMTKMKELRDVIKVALDKREKAKIPVRQVLGKLTVKGAEFDEGLLQLAKDELNVKEITLEAGDSLEVELDTNITPELLVEGLSRDLTRKLNNVRKAMGLTVEDKIELSYETDEENIKKSFETFKDRISQAVQAVSLTEGSSDGQEHEVPMKDAHLKVWVKRI